MATQGPSPSKLAEDSDTASVPRPSHASGNQQALEMDPEDVIEFVEPLPNELQCPLALCLEFLKEPTLTSCCGHHFCRECIDRAIARSIVCPLCNNQAFQTLINKEKQRLVNALKVYCKWKSRGCEWVGELGRLEHHLDVEEGDCGCVEVECEFGPVGCVAKLPRKDLQRHKEENVHKHLVLMSVMSLKSNEAFGRKLREQRVEFHQQLKQKVEKLQAIEKRLDEVERTQQQENQELCDVKGRLGQLETSLGDSQGQVKEVKEMIQRLEQGRSNTAEEMRGKIEQLESSLEESERLVKEVNEKVQKLEKHTFIPPPDFTMTDFEQHKKDGDVWHSPPFYSHISGYKMCLRVRAKGQGEGKGANDVSVFVHLMRGEYDAILKWPFRGDVTVKVLNQRAEERHGKWVFRIDDTISDDVAGRVIEPEIAEMGLSFIIFHSALGYDSWRNIEYLRNDCLKFRVTKIKLANL